MEKTARLFRKIIRYIPRLIDRNMSFKWIWYEHVARIPEYLLKIGEAEISKVYCLEEQGETYK